MKLVKLHPKATAKTEQIERPDFSDPDPDDHGFYPCYGEPGQTTLTTIPWEDDGYNIRGVPEGDNSTIKLWGLQTSIQVPISQIICDFYLLEAVAAQVPQGKTFVAPFNSQTLTEIVDMQLFPERYCDPNKALSYLAMVIQQRLVNVAAPYFANYSNYAISGELAHHWTTMHLFTKHRDEFTMHRVWKKMHKKFGGAKLAEWASIIFSDPGWDGTGYGGEAWKQCADVLMWYENGACNNMPFGGKQFIDRVFSLQHNGGSFLDKIEWWGGEDYWANLLDAHHNGKYDVLKTGASEYIQSMWDMANGEPFKTKELEWDIEYWMETDKHSSWCECSKCYTSCGCGCN